MTLEKNVRDNALTVSHWLDTCAQNVFAVECADCAGCPWLGGDCPDGLMGEAARVLAMLYQEGDDNYEDAKTAVHWLGNCIADSSCLAICKECPYANGCPGNLLRAAADLIRAGCNNQERC